MTQMGRAYPSKRGCDISCRGCDVAQMVVWPSGRDCEPGEGHSPAEGIMASLGWRRVVRMCRNSWPGHDLGFALRAMEAVHHG